MAKDGLFKPLSVKIITILATLIFTGYSWWMTAVWAIQTSQGVEIIDLKTQLASMSSKVNSIEKNTDLLVDKLINRRS